MINRLKINKPKIVLICFALCFLTVSIRSEAEIIKYKGKNWNVGINANNSWNDNVVLSPKEAAFTHPSLSKKKDDSVFEFSAVGKYNFKINKSFNMVFDYWLDHTAYSVLSQYDLQTHSLGSNAGYKIKPKWRTDLRYFFMYNILDGSSYNGIHYVSPSTMFQIHPKIGYTRINYTYQNKDNYQTNIRDMSVHSVGIRQYIYFSNFKKRINFGYAYKTYDASSPLFDKTSNIFSLGLKTPLFWGLNLKGRYKYIDIAYDSRALTTGGGKLRDDAKHNYMLEISKTLLKDISFLNSLTGSVKYERTTAESTDKFFEYDRNIFLIALKGVF